MGLFPGSKNSAITAITYGPLPDHGQPNVALVLHTTETRGMPGYREGATAPHYTYNPKYRTFNMHAEYEDGYVGTMKGHTFGGHGNCKAMQMEIVCYSDRHYATTYNGLWVGDFTDEMYADLARFIAWARARYGITQDVTATPPRGWRAGVGSEFRLSTDEWREYGGLTAHGAVPLNAHWDTGVLDLERISREGGVEMYTAWANEMFDLFSDKEITDLYEAGYIEGNPVDVIPYWINMRDIGSEARTSGQRREVARFIQTSEVSAWLHAAE